MNLCKPNKPPHTINHRSVRLRQAATLASLAEPAGDGAGPARALPPALHSLCVSAIERKRSVPPASGMRDAVRSRATAYVCACGRVRRLLLHAP